jgi:hypothetical protein
VPAFNRVRVDEPAANPTPIAMIAIGLESMAGIAAEDFAKSLIFP